MSRIRPYGTAPAVSGIATAGASRRADEALTPNGPRQSG